VHGGLGGKFLCSQVKAVQQNYFNGYTEFESGYWERDQDIILDPFAWIKLHVKNVNPYDEMDRFATSGPWGGAGIINTILEQW
jgi:hypothetical protein